MQITGVRPGHLRFGFSPARECLRGIRVLLRPARHAEQMPWVRDARRRFSKPLRASIERFAFFFEPNAESFPFVWDDGLRMDFDRELRELRANVDAYRDAVLVRLGGTRLVSAPELQRMRARRWYRAAAAEHAARVPRTAAMLDEFVASPARSLRAFCEMLAAFHAQVFEPAWPSIHERLTADIAMRERFVRAYGVTAFVRTLAPGVAAQRAASGTTVTLGPGEPAVAFDARSSLLLTPSFFCWPGHEAYVMRVAAGLRCTIAYPIPPLTARAAPFADRSALSGACAALGDPLRLRIVELLNARELSTRELAAYLHVAEPVASRHLHVLLRAGLVRQRRSSYFVLYSVCRETVRIVAGALAAVG